MHLSFHVNLSFFHVFDTKLYAQCTDLAASISHHIKLIKIWTYL